VSAASTVGMQARMDADVVKIAAAGDLHCAEPLRARITQAFERVAGTADLILLAGDLTTHGEPAQAQILAAACRTVHVPVCAVLGNHDHHVNRCEEVVAVLESAGIVVLRGGSVVFELGGLEVGVVGTKGFIGGFAGAEIPDFGEPLLREIYAETSREVAAIERGLEEVAGCHRRIVLLHYAPVADTLHGEPAGIHAFLGSARLAGPIGAHRPDLVIHGHAHHGAAEGMIGEIPVRNVAASVIGADFAHFELRDQSLAGA
jgi:Icc-related predicted phosphoesterase